MAFLPNGKREIYLHWTKVSMLLQVIKYTRMIKLQINIPGYKVLTLTILGTRLIPLIERPIKMGFASQHKLQSIDPTKVELSI